MLINKEPELGNVVSLKLVSGEELIAKLESQTDVSYVLQKPLMIGMSPKGPALMPYLFTVHPDKNVTIQKSFVVIIENSDNDFAKQYLESTSGIKLL